MKRFLAHDLLYGLHFNLEFQLLCPHVSRRDNVISVRVVKKSLLSTRDKTFDLEPITKKPRHYKVLSHLPCPANESKDCVLLRVANHKDETLLTLCSDVIWLRKQREVLALHKKGDLLRLHMECCENTCYIQVIRMGKYVGNDNGPLKGIAYYCDKMNQDKKTFLRAMQTFGLFEDLLLLRGFMRVPFFLYLFMGFHLDEKSLGFHGRQGQEKVLSWKEEMQTCLYFTSRFARKSSPFHSFLLWLDLLVGNTEALSEKTGEEEEKGGSVFAYPCGQRRHRRDSEVLGWRMATLDYLYSNSMSGLPFEEFLQSFWPMLLLIEDGGGKKTLLFGLGKRKSLSSLILNEDGPFELYVFSGRKRMPYNCHLISWRDYQENVLVLSIPDRLKGEGEGFLPRFSLKEVFVYREDKIKSLYSMAMAINSPPFLRPLIGFCDAFTVTDNLESLQLTEGEKEGGIFCPWQKGWINDESFMHPKGFNIKGRKKRA